MLLRIQVGKALAQCSYESALRKSQKVMPILFVRAWAIRIFQLQIDTYCVHTCNNRLWKCGFTEKARCSVYVIIRPFVGAAALLEFVRTTRLRSSSPALATPSRRPRPRAPQSVVDRRRARQRARDRGPRKSGSNLSGSMPA